ncbi:TerB family tellurite resistance protein [Candidatus Marinimicrobia bacterium]|nr:TerB family tellurite resistance protein [Candidatus Neomarinimicrobiota bacterium]MDC3333860.1 TerB family tellurite resistance protein [Candidatus Neomarinimicrobiota bacterium]
MTSSNKYVLSIILVSSLFAQKIELSSGFYHDKNQKDSIEVVSSLEKIDLQLTNGSKLRFFREDNEYRMQNLTNDGFTGLRLLNNNKFELYYDHSLPKSSFNSYELYKKPGVLNKVIAFLVTSALFISIFQFYLKLNKVWKRRTIAEVANSISIVAALLGFTVGFPFLLNSLFISGDYPAAGKSVLGLGMAVMMTLISMGYFVEENKGKNFFRLLFDALGAEKNESTDLLSAMLRPQGATKIIEILTQLAAIDEEVAQEEVDLINDFASKWRINIPEIKVGAPGKITNLVELKALVQSYLDEKPDVEVAQNLVDLINMMAEADDEVTDEEAMAVGEFTGMIGHYVSQEKGGSIDAFEVVIVPQNENQSNAVKELIPNIDSVKKQGGEIFIVGTFYSEDYAEAVCGKYISLGLFTNSIKVKI